MESVTDEMLLKEAQQILHSRDKYNRKRQIWLYGAFWAAAGALVTAGVWALTLWI